MDESTRGTAIAELQSLLLDTPGVDEFVEGVALGGRPPRRRGHLRHDHPAPRGSAHARRGERHGGPRSATRWSTRPTTVRA